MPEPTTHEPLSAERWAEIRDIAGIDSDPHTYQQIVTLALRDVIGELHWTQDTLAAHLALESADAAAGSYAGRAEEAEARAERAEAALAAIGKPIEAECRYITTDGHETEFDLHNEAGCGCRREERDIYAGPWRTADTTPMVCCECGSFDVAYRNYRRQLFCASCADGNGPAGQMTQARDEPRTALERATVEQGDGNE